MLICGSCARERLRFYGAGRRQDDELLPEAKRHLLGFGARGRLVALHLCGARLEMLLRIVDMALRPEFRGIAFETTVKSFFKSVM
jgi:hypothetical protein